MRRTLQILIPAVLSVGLVLGPAVPAFAAPPGNDDRADATVISDIPFSDSLSTVEATNEADEPQGCGGNAVWYSFTPSADIRLEANTFGSDYDTVITVWADLGGGSLGFVDCNDDAQGLQSRVRWDAVGGTTYHFQSGGFLGDTGNLLFNLLEAPPPVLVDFTIDGASVKPKTGVATLRTTLTCSETGGFVGIEASLRQRVGRRFISGFGFTEVECAGVTPVSIEITGEDGLFVAGRATAEAFAFSDGEFLEAFATVRMRGH